MLSSSKKYVFSTLLALCTGLVIASFSIGANQSNDETIKKQLEQANARLVEIFDQTDGMFYKTKKNENGSILYAVKWEYEGEVSPITLLVERQGVYNGEPVFALFAYSYVIDSDKNLPPAVIKKVPVSSDNGLFTSYCMTKDLNAVFVKGSIPSESLTSGQVWMLCTHVHISRVRMKKEIEQILAETSK